MGRPLEDMSGRRFDRLIVLSRGVNNGKSTTWNCLCDCGNHCVKNSQHLKNGDTQSCGCKHVENVTKHGMCDTLTYKSWCNLIHRTSDEYDDEVNKKYYEDKDVDPSWVGEGGFVNFLNDVGERLAENLSIDRINPLLGYNKDNCRWTDKSTQAQNTKDSLNPMRGLIWRKDRNKWQVQLGYNGTNNYVGLYSELKDAQEARVKAELKHWGWTNGILEVEIE